jgi:hypothetical protein
MWCSGACIWWHIMAQKWRCSRLVLPARAPGRHGGGLLRRAPDVLRPGRGDVERLDHGVAHGANAAVPHGADAAAARRLPVHDLLAALLALLALLAARPPTPTDPMWLWGTAASMVGLPSPLPVAPRTGRPEAETAGAWLLLLGGAWFWDGGGTEDGVRRRRPGTRRAGGKRLRSKQLRVSTLTPKILVPTGTYAAATCPATATCPPYLSDPTSLRPQPTPAGRGRVCDGHGPDAVGARGARPRHRRVHHGLHLGVQAARRLLRAPGASKGGFADLV